MNRDLIITAARELRRAIRQAPEAELDAAFQVLASDAQASIFADSHEPMARLAEAILTEQKQRLLTAGDDPEESSTFGRSQESSCRRRAHDA